jgi:ATP synthase protein I
VANSDPNDSSGAGRGRLIRNAAVAVNLVATFIAAVFGGFFLGFFLDRWLGTTPAFTLTTTFLGIAAAVYTVIREVKRLL